MTKRVTINTLAKQWDDYMQSCQHLFTPPEVALVADIARMPHQREDIVLAAKLMLFIFPRLDSNKVIPNTIRTWLRFLPHFVPEADIATAINAQWWRLLDGEPERTPDERKHLNSFLSDARHARLELLSEIDFFLTRAEIIPASDQLALHKACILLGVEYDSPMLPLGKTILQVLFPSFK